MPDELAGKSFGRYHLLEALGTGGMASVYRAYDPVEERDVALKILPAHLANNEIFRQRFFREAKTVAHLRHPNILPIYDFGKEGDMLYFVLKLVTGGSLADAIRDRSPLDYRTIVRIILQMAGALDYAHAQGIIHRDLKPENILLDKPTTAYLCDFGIAYSDATIGTVTRSGAFVGTALYASPEQCQGASLTFASDIYSFGAVLYEMLTGQPPYSGSSQIAIMHKQVNEPMPNPMLMRPDLPSPVGEVVRKAMAKQPNLRYQSAGAMATALHEALRHNLGSTGPLSPTAEIPGVDFSRPPETPVFGLPLMPPQELARHAPPADTHAAGVPSEHSVIQPLRREDLPPRTATRPASGSMPSRTGSNPRATQPRRWPIMMLWIGALLVVAAILVLFLLTR